MRDSPSGSSNVVSTQADTVTHAEPNFPWAQAPYPVLVADGSGTLVQHNDAARALLPAAHPGSRLTDVAPGWLAAAHRAVTAPDARGEQGPEAPAPASGEIDGLHFEAHSTLCADGTVAWWLVDDTNHRLAREALRTQRERTAFLAKASSLLLASLNLGRCMEVTARMAAEHLADAALAIAPSRGHRLPVVTCLRGDSPARRRRRWSPRTLPASVRRCAASPRCPPGGSTPPRPRTG